MKTQVLSISEFLNPPKNNGFSDKINRHFKKYGTVYKIVGSAAVILFIGYEPSYASSVIDREAKKLYYELASVGQWIIAFKGLIDVIKAAGNGDIEGAKRS